MAVKLIPPQYSTLRPDSPTPIPYTGSPLSLCLSDIRLFFRLAWTLQGILRPLTNWQNGPLDELYPSLPNLISIVLHAFLFVLQSVFLLSLPFLIIAPIWAMWAYFAVVFAVTFAVARVLNGQEDVLYSNIELGTETTNNPAECWMYINGVSVGKTWLQSNLDRLSLTFRRPIVGVHNRTYGILFDLLQCILERDFCYATLDIRRSYVTVKANLLNPDNSKVILILHSQGAIEGGLILDWLLTQLADITVPHDVVHKLEIYTFGSAANHFNNPPRQADSSTLAHNHNAVRYIEHYASDGDFVAQWGVLHFARLRNRFMGRVFIRPGTGHLLNQHYLNAMFPLDSAMRVKDTNEFMDMGVILTNNEFKETRNESVENNVNESYRGTSPDDRDGAVLVSGSGSDRQESKVTKPKVKHYSRLWLYRNGGSPKD